ncbi:MAG: hypothetical protein ACK559_15625, partial [bacterium]
EVAHPDLAGLVALGPQAGFEGVDLHVVQVDAGLGEAGQHEAQAEGEGAGLAGGGDVGLGAHRGGGQARGGEEPGQLEAHAVRGALVVEHLAQPAHGGAVQRQG